ncbi:MAG TPA: aromatic ring-hydroxylating dioxygenase subunit alpha [Caulobacteraceae bacterium]
MSQSSIPPHLLPSVRPGFSLPQGFYLEPGVFARDLDLLAAHWSFAAHVSELKEPGDWVTVELDRESAIIVRGEDGELRAFANVCRHRGSRICVEARGRSAFLTCPYHAWSYELDGRLRRAREMPDGFQPADYGLKSLPLREVGGLVFVAFAPEPPALDPAVPALERMLTHFDWPSARIAERRAYTVAANWKLAMENYHECYHCVPAHPEFARLHALARPNNRTLSDEPDALSGLADFENWGADGLDREVVRVMRSHLVSGCQTGSRDGQRLAPPMGEGGRRDDGLVVFAEVGPLSAFLAYPDHGVVYRFIPREPLRTEMEVIWLVDSAAEEGRDYDPEALVWLWEVTTLADKTIIERNQAGVRSRAYEPGPFSLMEPGTRQYVDRYVAEFAALEPAGTLV